MKRPARLLALLQLLHGRRRPVTAAVLAGELGISERTLYRDIADLIGQGAPIRGAAGLGYVLGPGLFLPPLMFGTEEVEALVLGLRYVQQRGDTVLGQAAAAALAKIDAMVPSALRDVVDHPVAVPGPPGWGYPPSPIDLGLLRRSIRAQRKLSLTYTDAARHRPLCGGGQCP